MPFWRAAASVARTRSRDGPAKETWQTSGGLMNFAQVFDP
jgi:hypothetical protein